MGESGFALSGGQQQRLCIARAIAVKPEILLMDEPCASLDPIATALIEDLMKELAADYTIVIVTHNMQQAARVSDRTAFFTAEVEDERHPVRHPGGVGRHVQDLHQPGGQPHRGLHLRPLRLTCVLSRPGSRQEQGERAARLVGQEPRRRHCEGLTDRDP